MTSRKIFPLGECNKALDRLASSIEGQEPEIELLRNYCNSAHNALRLLIRYIVPNEQKLKLQGMTVEDLRSMVAQDIRSMLEDPSRTAPVDEDNSDIEDEDAKEFGFSNAEEARDRLSSIKLARQMIFEAAQEEALTRQEKKDK